MKTPYPRSVQYSMALYRRLLLLYPAEFRRDVGAEMLKDFFQMCLHRVQQRGWRGILCLWPSILTDLLRTALAERFLGRIAITRLWVIRACGCLTMIGAMFSSLMLFHGEILARLIPGYADLPDSFVLPVPRQMMGVVVALGVSLFPALCYLFGALGLWLLQRSWLCRIAAGVAFLGLFMNGGLWFFTSASQLPSKSLLLLGIGIILCGVPIIQSRLLPRWNALPLILGAYLVCMSLSTSLSLGVIRSLLFLAPVASLVLLFLWGWLGYTLWTIKQEALSVRVDFADHQLGVELMKLMTLMNRVFQRTIAPSDLSRSDKYLYETYWLSRNGMGKVLAGLVFGAVYVVNWLMPASAVAIGLTIGLTGFWLLGKEILQSAYYERSRKVPEILSPGLRFSSMGFTITSVILAVGAWALEFLNGTLADPGTLGALFFITLLACIAWPYLRAPDDFVAGFFLLSICALACGGKSAPFLSQEPQLFPFLGLLFIVIGITEHYEFGKITAYLYGEKVSQ